MYWIAKGLNIGTYSHVYQSNDTEQTQFVSLKG